jgi:hypothetical protein
VFLFFKRGSWPIHPRRTTLFSTKLGTRPLLVSQQSELVRIKSKPGRPDLLPGPLLFSSGSPRFHPSASFLLHFRQKAHKIRRVDEPQAAVFSWRSEHPVLEAVLLHPVVEGTDAAGDQGRGGLGSEPGGQWRVAGWSRLAGAPAPSRSFWRSVVQLYPSEQRT